MKRERRYAAPRGNGSRLYIYRMVGVASIVVDAMMATSWTLLQSSS